MQYKLTHVTYMLRNSHNPTHVVNWTKHMKVLDVCLLKLQMLDLKGGHFIPASESQNVSESNSLGCEKIETIASLCCLSVHVSLASGVATGLEEKAFLLTGVVKETWRRLLVILKSQSLQSIEAVTFSFRVFWTFFAHPLHGGFFRSTTQRCRMCMYSHRFAARAARTVKCRGPKRR